MSLASTVPAPQPGSGDLGPDIATITQVVMHERQGRDRGWWEQMGHAYWPDSVVRLSWYQGDGAGFVAGSKAMGESGRTTVHRIYAPVVHIRGDRAHVEAPSAIRGPLEVDGVHGMLVVYSRLNYRLERRDLAWKITHLDAIYEGISLTPVVPGERINIPAAELAQHRPTYSILAWNMARRGLSVNDELMGDDRPGPVRAYYDEAWAWLTQSA